MAVLRSPLVLTLLTPVFFLSGIVINLLLCASWLFLRPFSVAAYHKANAALATIYWAQIIWLAEFWANIRVRIFGDPELFQKYMGHERSVALLNHVSDLDWIIGWLLADKFHCLGTIKCMVKDTLGKIPLLGWSWHFMEYIFLARKWETDRLNLQAAMRRLRTYPLPYWMGIFAEGTRQTPEKLLVSQQRARDANLPVFQNVMQPKTKAWVEAMQGLDGAVDSVLRVTIKYINAVPNVTNLFDDKNTEVHVLLTRVPAAAVPKDEAGLEQFCFETYAQMDRQLEQFKADGHFNAPECPRPRRMFSLLATLFWAAFATVVAGWLLAPLFAGWSLWYKAGALVAFLAVGDVLMRVLVSFFKQSAYRQGKRAVASPLSPSSPTAPTPQETDKTK